MGFAGGSFVRSSLCLCLLAWGGVVEAVPPGPAMPLGNPGEWITTSDYPKDALRNRIQGTTAFRLGIDSQGRVDKCDIVQGSGSDELDAAACALVTARAKFKPATNGRGRATRGTYTNRVRWVLPAARTRLAMPLRIRPLATVDANGNVVIVK